MNDQLLEMVAAHNRCSVSIDHYDHMSKDEWLATFKCEEDGTKLEIRCYGTSPTNAFDQLYEKWSDAKAGKKIDIFLPALEHIPTPKAPHFDDAEIF